MILDDVRSEFGILIITSEMVLRIFLIRYMEFQIWSDLCQKMLKNGLDYDFCENGSKDFAYMVS